MNTFWMILLSALATTGCYANPVSTGPGTSEVKSVSTAAVRKTSSVVNIRFDEIVTHDGLELRWLEINDSRCPTGENCFWAGEVKVVLEATNTTAQGSKPVNIQLTLQTRPSKTATASASGYVLELLNVDPYPKSKITTARSSYVAGIRISEAAQSK